jgi:hypothetical protein
MSEAPPLAVVMPVRNALPFLDESIASILGQSFADFEFAIYDDSSDDGSSEGLRQWAQRDPRIRLARGDERLGPAGSSQAAVEMSRAPLVARMDADDVSHPDRLRRLMEVFAAHPDAVLAGSLSRVIGPGGRLLRDVERAPLARPSVSPPFCHGSIMFRRQALDRAGGYRVGTDYWEDLDLYARLAAMGRVFVLPRALYDVRYSDRGTRAAAEPAELDRAYARMSATLGRSPPRAPGRIPPGIFVLSGSPRLWAGTRPRVLRRLLADGDLGWNRASLGALAWALWAEASPASLRLALRALGRLRERKARSLAVIPWIEWRPKPPGPP